MSPKGAARLGSREGYGRYFDFSRGDQGDISEYGLPVRHLRDSDNLEAGPSRAMGKSRLGTIEAQASALDYEPTTMGLYIPDTGIKRLLFHCKSTLPGAGFIRAIADAAPGVINVAAPISVTDKPWSIDQLNNALFCAQPGDSTAPMMYHRYGGGGTYALESMVLGVPASQPTTGAAALSGGVTPGDHYYRTRFRYRNGASKTSPVSAVITVVAATEKVTVTLASTEPTTQDYLGWTLERTKVGAPASGGAPTAQALWYLVADVNAGTATYDDTRPDADLFEVIDDGLFGDPPHLEGLIARNDRLYGWAGASLFVSQSIADQHATGLCNWDPDLEYPIGEADGDAVLCVVKQADRFLIWKHNSVHAFEGTDPDNFRTYKLADIGIAGARCAASMGSTVWALGVDGLHMIVGNAVNPGRRRFGDQEVGQWLADINETYRYKAKMLVYQGDKLLLWLPLGTDEHMGDVIAYDFRAQMFRHYTDWWASDAVVQRDDASSFGGSRLLFCDPRKTAAPGSQDFGLNPSAIVWVDSRATSQTYAQKVGSTGVPLWTSDGVLLGSATVGTLEADIVSDTLGGWLVAYCESRGAGTGYDLYVQRLDPSGTKLWGGSGFLVYAGAGTDDLPRLTPDGTGGCFVTWQDGTNVRVHRITSAGAKDAAWPANGAVLDVVAWTDNRPGHVLYDGSYVYVTWQPHSGSTENRAVTKLNASDGSAASPWTLAGYSQAGGDAIAFAGDWPPTFCLDGQGGMLVPYTPTTTSLQIRKVQDGAQVWISANLEPTVSFPQQVCVVSDGVGGCLVAWGLGGTGSTLRPRAHRVTDAGSLAWASPIFLTTDTTYTSALNLQVDAVQDGDGGMIVAWCYAAGPVWLQRVDKDGNTMWGATGVMVRDTTLANSARNPRLCSDGAHGAIVTWRDNRGGTNDIYAQRVDANGNPLWTANGVPVCVAAGNQNQPVIAFTNTPANEYPATADAYRIWRGFAGELEGVGYDGSGGEPIIFRASTPWIDDGIPDVVKELERLELEVEGDAGQLSAVLNLDQKDRVESIALTLEMETSGTVLGDETDTIGPDDLQVANEDGSATGIVGKDYIAGDSVQTPHIPLPFEAWGYRYSLDLLAERTSPLTVLGFVVDGTVSPERSL